jgi:hypothetical protein
MYSSEREGWDDRLKALVETYEWLEEEGRCVPIQDPRFEETTRLHPLHVAAEADLQDEDFVRRCKANQNAKYVIPDDVPRAKVKGGGLSYRPPVHRNDLGLVGLCAERVNSTLYLAETLRLVPVSNQRMFSDLFASKLKRALEAPEFIRERQALDQFQKFRLNVLSWTLYTEGIPRRVIHQKSIKQIVRYTEEAGDLRARYRGYVSMLESTLSTEPWEPKLGEEIDKLVRGKVIPEVQRLSDERKELWEKLFGEVVKVSIRKRYLLPALSVTLIPTVSYWDLLWYGTVGVAGSAWLSDLVSNVTDFLVERRKLRRHGLFFLLNFK